MLSEKTERQSARKHETTPWGDGHTTIPSSPLSSWDLGHTRTHTGSSFKFVTLGLELHSNIWEASGITITTSTGPSKSLFLCSLFDV